MQVVSSTLLNLKEIVRRWSVCFFETTLENEVILEKTTQESWSSIVMEI